MSPSKAEDQVLGLSDFNLERSGSGSIKGLRPSVKSSSLTEGVKESLDKIIPSVFKQEKNPLQALRAEPEQDHKLSVGDEMDFDDEPVLPSAMSTKEDSESALSQMGKFFQSKFKSD